MITATEAYDLLADLRDGRTLSAATGRALAEWVASRDQQATDNDAALVPSHVMRAVTLGALLTEAERTVWATWLVTLDAADVRRIFASLARVAIPCALAEVRRCVGLINAYNEAA